MVGIMRYESILSKIPKRNVGRSQILINSKERMHISKSDLDRYKSTTYLQIDEANELRFDESGTRYLASLDLTYDTLVSVYEKNTRSVLVVRFYDDPKTVVSKISGFVKALKYKEGVEGRVMGMQSNNYPFEVNTLISNMEGLGICIKELDLFGTSVRHIAIDSKLGSSIDILKEDRLYRAGELANLKSLPEFKAEMTQLIEKRTTLMEMKGRVSGSTKQAF